MRARLILLALLCLAVPALGAPQTQTVTDADSETTVTLHPGDTLLVRLRSNPSTGYAWNIVTDPAAPFRLAGTPRTAIDKHAPGMVGVGGVTEFRFTVSGRAGYTRGAYLRLLSLRAFQKGIEGATLWEVNVTVRAKNEGAMQRAGRDSR